MKIGAISDTHGLLRPEAVKLLRGCERIVHAGDIGDPDVVAGLNRVARVTAVRGNNDTDPWGSRLPDCVTLNVVGRKIHVVHNIRALALDEDVDVVVYGHSHKPSMETVEGVLFLNPGSAGPRRFSLPVTLAILTVGPKGVTAKIVEIPV